MSISKDCFKETLAKRKTLLPTLLGAKPLNKKVCFKLGSLTVDATVCSDEDIGNFSKPYAESLKRYRPEYTKSPTNNMQEIKNSKS